MIYSCLYIYSADETVFVMCAKWESLNEERQWYDWQAMREFFFCNPNENREKKIDECIQSMV